MNIPYESVETYPEKISATAIMIRMLDGLGFRFRYATEGFTLQDYQFSPGHDCRTIGEIIEHYLGTAQLDVSKHLRRRRNTSHRDCITKDSCPGIDYKTTNVFCTD